MKRKPLIPFPVLEKYKYVYFVINSAVTAFITVLVAKLLSPIMGEDFSLGYMFSQFFVCWAMMYPASFAIFEAVKKAYKKEQEKKME